MNRQRSYHEIFGNRPCVDAPGDRYLIVTQEDIDNAVPGCSENCILALAIKHSFQTIAAQCYYKAIRIQRDDLNVVWRFEPPTDLRRLMEAIDDGRAADIKPGEYRLKRFRDSQLLGNRKNYPKYENGDTTQGKGRGKPRNIKGGRFGGGKCSAKVA